MSCVEPSYWVDEQLAWPRARLGDEPNEDLDGNLLVLYEEAREVAPISPRAAAALLRLLVEQLTVELGETKGGLADRIGRLADNGVVPARTVDAWDAVRHGGNDAVHAGLIDPDGNDDAAVVVLLFTLVNLIVENAISLPKRTSEFLGLRKRPG